MLSFINRALAFTICLFVRGNDKIVFILGCSGEIMPAQTYSASLVNQLAVPKHRAVEGYYRSKLFIASSTTNPLVAAAGPVFSLLERLCISPTLPPIESIRDNIEHELQAFHSRLTGQNYTEELIVIAHYLLCATIDELLGKNYMRLHGTVAEFQSFTPPSANDVGPEKRFFEIVHHIKERINQYLDIIELAYYCLIAGFEGEQHVQASGRQTLDNLIEELYQIIQNYRVNKPHRLFKINPPAPSESKSYKPLATAGFITFIMLLSIFFTSHALLEQKAKRILNDHAVLVAHENTRFMT